MVEDRNELELAKQALHEEAKRRQEDLDDLRQLGCGDNLLECLQGIYDSITSGLSNYEEEEFREVVKAHLNER